MEDIIRGYKFSKDLKKKPWTVDEMVRFINRENQEGFYEYVNAFWYLDKSKFYDIITIQN